MRLKKLIIGNLWLIIGALSFLGTAISSIVRSFQPGGLAPPTGIVDILYVIIDWLAACVIYFFLGALIGHLIDLIMAKIRKKPAKTPLWFWLTAALWIIGSITLAIINNPDISPILIWIFPLAFGVFFTGFAFTMLFPDAIVYSYAGKLVFDIVFLGVFFSWVYLALKEPEKHKLALRILLGIIFFAFFLGFIGCASSI